MSAKKPRKTSLTAKVTIVCLSITFLTALLLSVVFMTNARGIIQEQATTSTVDNIHTLRDQLLASFNEWGALVRFTAVAASSVIVQEPFDPGALQILFRRNSDLAPEAKLLYASSNVRWTEPGGFVVREDGLIPPVAWDNRERPWFIAAKQNPGPGNVGHTDPYIDAITGELTVSLSTNIYDDLGRDLGVVAADFGLAFLTAMLEEKVTIPGHRIFLINRQGLFITHHDTAALLRDDFFNELGLAHYRSDVLGRPHFSHMGRDVLIYSELIPLLDWILVSTIPTAAIFAEMNDFMLRMILIGVMLLAVAAFVSIIFTYRELTVPVRSIKSAADSLAVMDFTVEIKKTESDEIGDMQLALITIRDNLKKGIEDMKVTHENDMRMMEIEQKKFKERTHTILDAAPMVCAIYNESGSIVDVNLEVTHMLGISDPKIFIKDANRFLPKHQPDGSDSIAKSTAEIQRCIREGSVRYEWTYLHSDGSLIPTEEIMHRVEIDGKPHVIAFSRDLREYYREREKERVLQGKIQAMMQQLNEHVETQAASVDASSSAVEQMIANIRSVTNTLSANARNVRGLEDASQAGHSSLNEVVTDIQGIARESESLLEINSVMQNIASQTNLLSMNAAIEAAHAGDSGRGFAVVADEIRKLAENSSKQSKTISGVLKSIKGSIDKITKSTDVVLNKFDAIGDGVKTVVGQENTILQAMEEQGEGSKQILQSIGTVNEVTHQVKEAARRMVETSKESLHKTNDVEAKSFTDELTGLRNRAYFTENAEQELRYCIDENREFNLIMYSVNNLHQITEAHGESVRDEVFKILSMRARNSFKQGNLLARYSENEFVITLPNVRHGTAVKLAEQLQNRVKDAPFAMKGLRLDIGISFSVAVKTPASKTLHDIISNAAGTLSGARTAKSGMLASVS